MTLTALEWGALITVGGLAVSVISFFLVRTIKTTDTHGKDIDEIKQTYASKDELEGAKNGIQQEIRRFSDNVAKTTGSHDKDITHIKLTYVSKDELKDVKADVQQEIRRLSDDVASIKNGYLTKDDFYRKQAETDRRLEQIYDLLMKMNGGRDDGK